LYPDGYAAGVTPARILLPAAIATLSVAWTKAFPAAVGRPKVRSWVSFAELAITLVVVLPLAPRGVTGAAAAISLATMASAVIWWVVAHRMLRAMAKGSELGR
jgi:O-antigen/teichoic acid export membrane protein